MRLFGRAAVLVALAAALSCVAAPARAHAYLDHSNPGDGTSLTSAPDSLRLAFSEHVVLSATTLELLDDDAHAVPVRHLRLVSDDPEDTEAPAQLVADLPQLSRGAYRLTWSTLSSDDLHRTSGVVVFGIRTTVAGGGVHESSPDPLEAASGTAVLAGAALLLGAPLALHTLRRAPAPARRRVRRVAVTGGVVALVVGLLTVVRVAWTDDLAALAAGGYAVRWLVRTVGLVLLVHGVRGDRRVSLLLGALLTATGEALLGHAVAQVAGDPLRVPVTAVHLLAALGWTGAVVGIAVGLGLRPDRMLPVPELRADLRRFALPAATGLAVAVTTGAWLTSDVVVSVDAALLTSYGRTLLLKVGLVGAVCALALLNHRRLRGPRDLEVPRRTIGAEAVAIGGLLVATALLVAGQPATEPQLVDAGPAANHGPVARQVADLEETVGLKPNRAGSSVVLVDVFDRRRPAPGPISDVAVRIGDRALGSARSLGNGHWSVPVSDLEGGRTAVTITVTRAGAEPVTATYPWVVGASTPHPDVVVSRAPATSALRLLAGAFGVVAVCAAVVARRRRPRPRAVVPAAEPEKETVS